MKNYFCCRRQDLSAVRFSSPKRDAFVSFSEDSFEACELGAGFCEMPAGSSNEKHVHEKGSEVIMVIYGTFKFVFPGEEVILNPFDTIYIPKGIEHQIFNIGNTIGIHTFTFSDPVESGNILRKV